MLSLFPMEYWIILAVAASGRFISGQLLSRRLSQLRTDSKYKLLLNTVGSRQFMLFLRFNGLAHLLLVVGLVTMFYMTYQYIVPINPGSVRMLYLVRSIGNVLVIMEIVNAALAISLTTFLLRKKT